MTREKQHSRRELLLGLGRGAALGALGALAVVLARRGRGAARQACVNRGFCRRCGVLDGCALPQATHARRAARKRNS